MLPSLSPDIPGTSSSVIIIYQLEDKLKAHSRYLQFITDIGLLDKVRGWINMNDWPACLSSAAFCLCSVS